MKKKFLSFILALIMVIPCVSMLSACLQDPPPEGPPTGAVYTVTEDEWKINFNLTKGQAPSQPQPLCTSSNKGNSLSLYSSQPLQAITSYTIDAVGVNYGINGSCCLKVAPNAMSIEFYLEGQFREDESGTTPSNDAFYIGLTSSVMSYFPFANNYNDFTFDETKNAYVAQNFTVAVINEEDITDTYDLYTKTAEVSFINGYLNTISIELAEDNTYTTVYSSFVFTFSDMNNTTVEI